MRLLEDKPGFVFVSPRMVWLLALPAGISKSARAAALFPFIFVKHESHATERLMLHEHIHFRQQVELLVIGAIILGFAERAYARWILGKSTTQAYLWESAEQEAYQNQFDPDYLSKRKVFASFKYLFTKNKKKLVYRYVNNEGTYYPE